MNRETLFTLCASSLCASSLLVTAGCDSPSAPDASVLDAAEDAAEDAGISTDSPVLGIDAGPDRSAAIRGMLANPAPDEQELGERLFFEYTWSAELANPVAPADFLVALWQGDEARWGEQFSNFGFIPDPDDDLPVGLKRGSSDPTMATLTCASCHVSRLDDGRLWAGFPAVSLRLSAFTLAVDEAWVAAGNPSTLTPAVTARLALFPQPGVTDVGPTDSDIITPVDFPYYLNFGSRRLFGTDGAAGDARSVIMLSIFSQRGSANPAPFPEPALTGPFIEYLVSLETPRGPAGDPALVAAGRAIFEREQCNGCHHPEDQRLEDSIDWVETGPELLPGVDAAHPHGTIATDGNRLAQTMFSGGVDPGTMEFIRFITRNHLMVRMPSGYIPRDIRGVFASAPYLHNGSVPTLEDLLRPASERPTTFMVRGQPVDVTVAGMSNGGHEFGTSITDEERTALVAYLNSL